MRRTLCLSHALHLIGWIVFAAGCWYEIYLAMALGQIVALMNILWLYVPIVVNLVVVSALVGAGFVARSVSGAAVQSGNVLPLGCNRRSAVHGQECGDKGAGSQSG